MRPDRNALRITLSGSDRTFGVPLPDAGDVLVAARILVAEGDGPTRSRLQRALTAAGCEVDAVADMRYALIASRRAQPDLVIADAGLSRFGWLSMLRRLRAHPATRWVPIILLAARSGSAVHSVGEARDAALNAGANEYLVRPVAARELVARAGFHLAMARVGRVSSEAVLASERRLAEVLDAVEEAVFALDEEERIQFVNRKALELWRLPPRELVGHRLSEAVPEIETGAAYRAYREVIVNRRHIHLETQSPSLGGRWISLDAHPAPNGGVVVAFRDIDETKQAETRLRESEERFRLMLEALPQIAFVIRADGIAEYYNQQFRDYVGGPIGVDPASRTALHHPDDRPRVDAARKSAAASGLEYTVEARICRHDGLYRWHRIQNRPLRFDGKVAFWLGTAVDIDDMRQANRILEERVAERTAELERANRRLAGQIEERERAEALLRQAQRTEAVGQVTSGIAHDFNNLLTAVIGNIELLDVRLGRRDEHTARLIGSARAAAERGARLTAQLLAFSRQQRMTPEPVNLNDIVTGMGALLQSTIGATVQVETVLSETLWPGLADTSQIELVLLNLAINARDAMARGGTIKIETANVTTGEPRRAEEPPPGDYATIAVADSGAGIPPEILDKVFDPFFTTKEVGKGSGLGLSQVLGVAKQLGGGVHIESQPGHGCTVRVYLPRVAEAEALRQDRGIDGPRDAVDRKRRCTGVILLVDDDADVRAVAAGMLREARHRVIEADSGDAALECLKQPERVGLMIADIAMPGMNGIELSRIVRALRPELPILFVTGFAGTTVPLEDAAPEQLLRKPFRAAELAAKVEMMLGHGDDARLGSRN
jgi:PAS domain S-box-containing protein